MSFKRILAIGAHPDDVELGCSGTLLKYQAEGSHIDIVVCRDDNAPKPSVWRDKEKMQQEYKNSEELFGVKFNILKIASLSKSWTILCTMAITILSLRTVQVTTIRTMLILSILSIHHCVDGKVNFG